MATPLKLALQEGDPAPGFTVRTQRGEEMNLSQYRGRWVVLYFYPRDDTPGCTREACGFRDAHEALLARGVVVLGVSTDSEKTHAKFAVKFDLPFLLLADVDRALVTSYGVWGQKKFMGRTYDGTHRVTFLIGPDQRIRRIWEQVKPETQAQEVLAALDELQ